MTRSTSAPLLFVSHGAPTFALEPGILGQQLHNIGRLLTNVNAILVLSPHWQTTGLEVMTNPLPDTVHDFYGFPPALYTLSYPVKGAVNIAQLAIESLRQAGLAVTENPTQGLDHGAWVPLMHLLPGGNIPAFQVSMPHDLDPYRAYQLGQILGQLRTEGVMIIGSGSMTHNLRDFRQGTSGNIPYVNEFASWVKHAVQNDQLEQLLNYRNVAPHALRAHPTEEHFLPLFVALGARLGDTHLKTIDGGIRYGMLSMDSFIWGLTEST